MSVRVVSEENPPSPTHPHTHPKRVHEINDLETSHLFIWLNKTEWIFTFYNKVTPQGWEDIVTCLRSSVRVCACLCICVCVLCMHVYTHECMNDCMYSHVFVKGVCRGVFVWVSACGWKSESASGCWCCEAENNSLSSLSDTTCHSHLNAKRALLAAWPNFLFNFLTV